MNDVCLREMRCWYSLSLCNLEDSLEKYKTVSIHLGKKVNIYNYTLKMTNTSKFRKINFTGHSPIIFVHKNFSTTTTTRIPFQNNEWSWDTVTYSDFLKI